LAAGGKLEAADDVFHLAWFDLDTFLREEWGGQGARNLVADRKAREAAWRAGEDPPDGFFAYGPSLPPPRLPPEGGGLVGVGVAAGRASGAARILRHPDEGRRLQKGEVLVAPTTDPGWTPLFLRASALVLEVGGYLSHGAIVAREYGIPAVVNLPGVLGA